jgi:hypothetical protein
MKMEQSVLKHSKTLAFKLQMPMNCPEESRQQDVTYETNTKNFLCTFQPEFYQVCHTKAAYEEYGPSICRHNPVFGTMT